MTRRRTLSHARWPLAGFVAVLVVLGGVAPIASRAQGSEGQVRFVGRFKSIVSTTELSQTRLHVAPKQRILYSVDLTGPASVGAQDLDSFAPFGTSVAGGKRGYTALTDSATGDLLLPVGPTQDVTTQLERYGVTDGKLVFRGSLNLAPALQGRTVAGMAAEPGSSRVYLLSAAIALGATSDRTGLLTQVDIGGTGPSWGSVGWSQPLNQCQAPIFDPRWGSGLGFVAAPPSLVLGCRGPSKNGGFFLHPPLPGGAAVLSLSRTGNGAPQPGAFALYRYPLDFDPANAGSVFDPGSGRLVMVGTENITQQYGLVFDARDRAYVGRSSLGATLNGIVVDSGIGRFYAVSAGNEGLKVFDVRATPVGQGLRYPSFARNPNGKPPGLAPITADPVTNRLFVSYGSEAAFDVIHDGVPPYVQPPEPDPDALTLDIPEVPGRTGATWSAAAQGYGARYRLVGGTGAIQLNFTHLEAGPQQRPESRELRTTWLDRLVVANGESSAAGIVADRDEKQTRKDEQDLDGGIEEGYGHVPEGQRPVPAPTVAWPYHPVQCTDFGGQHATTEDDERTTRVECNLEQEKSAFASRFSDAGTDLVESQRTSVEATTRLDPVRGAVTEVVAEAHNITALQGALRIGRVRTKAAASAHGRRGTAHGSFEVDVDEVEVNGQQVCKSDCPLPLVAQAVNNQLGDQLRVDFPAPDAEFLQGSPGGYQALVRRPRAKRWEDVTLEDEPEDRLTVPGMTLTFYHDNYTPGRLVADFAGVEAEARYGIYALGQYGDDDADADAGLSGGDLSNGLVNGVFPGGPDGLGLAAALSPDGGLGPMGRIVRRAGFGLPPATGWRLLAGLGRSASLLPVWAILLVPVYLSARRWLLLQRGRMFPRIPH